MQVIVTGGEIPEEEKAAYIKYCLEKYKDKRIDRLEIKINGEYVELFVDFKPVKFDRIRRITGYLVGTLERFNDAKQAEVKDRLKHNI